MVKGWIRVSKVKPYEHQKFGILEYANRDGFKVDSWFVTQISTRKNREERQINKFMDELVKGDVVIMTELSRFGRNARENLDFGDEFIDKGVRFIMIKDGFDIQGKFKPHEKMFFTMMSAFAEMERDRTSERIKEALANKQAEFEARGKGEKLGRPKGPGKSKLDDKEDYIRELVVDKRMSKLSVSKFLGVSYATLFNFCKKKKIRKLNK